MRLLLASLVLGLAACSQPSGLAPDAAYDLATELARAGDTDRALALVEEAAAGGHLVALRRLAHGYRHGIVFLGPDDAPGRIEVGRTPRAERRVQRAYERALADSLRAGSDQARLFVASGLMGGWMILTDTTGLPDGARASWRIPQSEVDSARALYRQIADGDLPPLELAPLARAVGDEPAYRRHLAQAIARGERDGCVLDVLAEHGQPDVRSAGGLSLFIDRLTACDPREPWGDEMLANIRQSAEDGSARAAGTLDSLRALGLAERYPHLAVHLSDA